MIVYCTVLPVIVIDRFYFILGIKGLCDGGHMPPVGVQFVSEGE